MLRCKFCWAGAALVLVVGSAVAFRAITGKCPIACMVSCEAPTETAPAETTPATQKP